MASGYGINGGQGRCFPQWQGFLSCYAEASAPGQCQFPMADYFECLHHGAEIKRAKMVKYEMLKQEELQGIKPRTKKEMLDGVPRLNIVKD